MKKLLIAMSAAAMFSLCAKADDPTLLGSTDFESGYVVGNPIGTGAVDPGSASSLIFWYGSNGESEILEESEGGNKYLKVDTPEELTRKTAALNEDTNPVDPVGIGGGDITISSKVQFTAADEAPEAAEDDKLIVWAKAPDEDDPTSTTTNLVVTAKTAGGVVTNFVTDTLIEADTWYNLQIVAKAEGTNRTATSTFVVKIAEAGQTPTAVTVDNEEVSFYSLLAAGATGAQTITSIGFKGTGAVDDIVFAKNEAVAPVPVTISYTVNGSADDAEAPIVSFDPSEGTKVGDTLTILVTANPTASVACTGLTFTYIPWDEVSGEGYDAWVATYTLTAADGEAGTKAFAITVTEGGAGAIVPNMDGVPATVTFSPEFAASYTAGQTIDPTLITASTSKPGYTVSFEIFVGETKITEATLLTEDDTITVTATETAIEYTITYTYADENSNPLTDVENTNTNKFTVEDAVTIDSAKISKEGYTVTSVTPATIAQGTTENQTVAVVLTADAPQTTYTVTAEAVEGATVNFSTTDPVVSGTTVTFTIEVTAANKEIDAVSDGANTLTADGQGVYSVTVVDADIVITVTLKDKTTPAGDWPETWNNGAAATPAQAAAFTEWAKTNDATAENAQAAFLTGQSVATYTEVAFTSITIVDNKVVLTENVDLSNANGVVKIKYGATPTSLTNTAELGAELPATAPALFYKIVVDFQ